MKEVTSRPTNCQKSVVEVNWKAHHPYPTNPFKRVDGKELEKLHQQLKKKTPKPIYAEALL